MDLRPYKFSGVNITGIRLLNPNDKVVKKLLLDKLNDLDVEKIENLYTDEALIFDAVLLFSQAIKDLLIGINSIDIKSINCKDDDIWNYGLSLQNYLTYVSIYNYEYF